MMTPCVVSTRKQEKYKDEFILRDHVMNLRAPKLVTAGLSVLISFLPRVDC